MTDHAEMWRDMSIGTFVLCLLMPGYYAEGTNLYGWFLLLFGFCGLPTGEISWLANLALYSCWVTLTGAPRIVPQACAVVALALALSFAVQDTAWSYNWSGEEAEFSLRFGYYFWLVSMGFAAVAAFKNNPKR